jgi:hAT family C-terminal dimerisation region
LSLHAAYWWQQFGSQCHELQKFAVRILSQTCSASGCERNWSVFERIHTKKRNRLEQKRLNDMVFVQYNLRLRRNQLMNKTPESSNIFLDDIDPSSDWVVETQPAAFDHEDLSWMDLDPEPHQENVATDAAQPAPVSLPSGPGESSQAQNPPVQSTHVENVESDDDSESDSESSEASFQYADSDY